MASVAVWKRPHALFGQGLRYSRHCGAHTSSAFSNGKSHCRLGRYFGFRPMFSQSLYQKRENGPAVACCINVAWTKVTHQQMPTAKHIQGLEAVVVIRTVKNRCSCSPCSGVSVASKSSINRLGGLSWLPTNWSNKT